MHEVKPECSTDYETQAGQQLTTLHEDQSLPQKLVGSFRVMYGSQDEVVHIWRYDGGYASINKAADMINGKKGYVDYRKQRASQIHRRRNQLLLQFEHMPDPTPREGGNIYELRSYNLKSGTIGEWHHNWAHIGLKCRAEREMVTGFFTHAGPLNLVHHLWCYKDLTEREKIRSKAWMHADWGVHVRNTVVVDSR